MAQIVFIKSNCIYTDYCIYTYLWLRLPLRILVWTWIQWLEILITMLKHTIVAPYTYCFYHTIKWKFNFNFNDRQTDRPTRNTSQKYLQMEWDWQDGNSLLTKVRPLRNGIHIKTTPPLKKWFLLKTGSPFENRQL